MILAFGKPILWLFGPQFVDGYFLMFILAIGPLARATVGPVERLLNMVGEQRACAVVYGSAFAVNIALCVLLIPLFGVAGAAVAISGAMILEAALLFGVAKQRLGLHVFVWRPARNPHLRRSKMMRAGAAPVGLGAGARRGCTAPCVGGARRMEAAFGAWPRCATNGAISVARALEPNVFYDPAFALPAAPRVRHRCRRRAGVVEGRAGA